MYKCIKLPSFGKGRGDEALRITEIRWLVQIAGYSEVRWQESDEALRIKNWMTRKMLNDPIYTIRMDEALRW